MLEIRPVCENCSRSLPNDSTEAMICTYECTFCRECVNEILFNVCPNCGGGFEKRPSRPSIKLVKDPAGTNAYYKPIDNESFKLKLEQYKSVEPNQR
jgi:uncharacterized protein